MAWDGCHKVPKGEKDKSGTKTVDFLKKYCVHVNCPELNSCTEITSMLQLWEKLKN
jgi:hypothetical protein